MFASEHYALTCICQYFMTLAAFLIEGIQRNDTYLIHLSL